MSQDEEPVKVRDREPKAATVDKMYEGKRGVTGNSGMTGMSGPPGPPGPPGFIVKDNDNIANIFRAVALLLFVVSLVLSQIFAWRQVSSLQDQVSAYAVQDQSSKAQSDCLALYRNDVSVATGTAVAASNDALTSLIQRAPATTPQEILERQVENARVANFVAKANAPLTKAASALAAYDQLDPEPNLCPHPNAVEQRARTQEDGE